MLYEISRAVRVVVTLAVLTGLIFPLGATVAAHILFPNQAGGSLIREKGRVVGAALIGQKFTQPQYFHGRPSAAGDGYDAAASAGTNLGPTSAKLVQGSHPTSSGGKSAESFDGAADLAVQYRTENGLQQLEKIPVDAVTRSASGLDPHISPANARLQAKRVAAKRGIPLQEVLALIDRTTEPPTLGFLGEARVNVLLLNLALDRR
jgi:K+-transporting ATPase ATPase C chain